MEGDGRCRAGLGGCMMLTDLLYRVRKMELRDRGVRVDPEDAE